MLNIYIYDIIFIDTNASLTENRLFTDFISEIVQSQLRLDLALWLVIVLVMSLVTHQSHRGNPCTAAGEEVE